MNRIVFAASAVLGLGLASASLAQTQTPPPPKPTSEQNQPSQTRPDARYPRPSGQDSKPNEDPPKKGPQDKAKWPHPSDIAKSNDKQGAGKDVYTGSTTGKKPNSSTACTTPTDAQSAHGQANNPAGKSQSRDTVCNTSGGDSATRPRAKDHAQDKPEKQ